MFGKRTAYAPVAERAAAAQSWIRMPGLPLSAAGRALVLIATDAHGRYGHPIRFDAALRPAFAALTGDEGARAVVRSTRLQRPFPLPGDHATRDLDTPEDWADWRATSRRASRKASPYSLRP